MVNQVVWTLKARNELIDIIEYWIFRNKSNTFSLKLNSLIQEQLKLVSEFPEIGKITDIPGVNVTIVNNYMLYYEIADNSIYVLTLRHTSRNPKTIRIK